MFRFLQSQSRPLRSQAPPRQLQRREITPHQHQSFIGNEGGVEGELTAEHHLREGAVVEQHL